MGGRRFVFFACNNEEHPVKCRDESDVTAVELAALQHELAVDPLLWFADFAKKKHWHSSDAVYQQLQVLIQIWYTYDQVNFGGVAAVGQPARQIQSHVDAHRNPDDVSWEGLRFYTRSRRAGNALVPSSAACCPSDQGFQGNPADVSERMLVWC